MRWQSLVSTQNLKLAWRRINTARNLQYKRFFRPLFLVYESAVDDNLKELHRRLVARAWHPNHCERVYLPKPSGLQRPISLLGVEDQIVLQCIANLFARKLRSKRDRVELDTVFSNILTDPGDSIFFTERWQVTYGRFQEKCKEHFANGHRWAAHFDLSAYYDTISHDLLIRIASPRMAHPETWDEIRRWLQTWSAADPSAMTGHGIPQGPIASDFLAEAFFLPIDLELQKKGCTYVRYVDDIRLFGKTENEVRAAAIMLEQMCRHRGLIPQSKKFEIRALTSVDDAMGALPSIPPGDGRERGESAMSVAEAQRLFKSAVGGKPLRITDKSRFRYVMYRAPLDSKLLTAALMMLPRHPEHIDAFVAYFSNFTRRRRIARAAIRYLQTGLPYSYVRGELWHVIARLGGTDELAEALPLAREDAAKRGECVALSWGVMHFLIRCQQVGLSRLGRRLASEKPLSRAFLSPILPDREFSRDGRARDLLRGTPEEQLAAARELQQRGVALTTLGLRQRDLSALCRDSLRALGVIRRRHRRMTDWVAEGLTALYGCADVHIWRELLSGEYEHASQILVEARARYPGAYSEWLALQDSFNDIAVRQFFAFLTGRGLPGHSTVTSHTGRLVKYGNLIQPGGPFDTHYTAEAGLLRRIHTRRNGLPGSHPYDERGGAKNRWLEKRERDALTIAVRDAMNGLAAAVQANLT
jgi:hypothetical protein